MKVLVTGADGQLGYDVVKRLQMEKIECLGTNRDTLDITDRKNVLEVMKEYNPDIVIHCAAYTAVDQGEEDKDLCYTVNTLGTKYIAEACEIVDAKMVYISTDYVFDGKGNKPFEITDQPNPINYYGETKYKGELEVQNILEKHFIVRISWVFGINGNNFVKTMLQLGEKRDEISVVADQMGSPTSTYDLSKVLVDMIQTDKYGVYHITNEGYCSWYEFALEIFKIAEIEVKVKKINSIDFPTKAIRPKNSRLSNESFLKMQNWKDALKDYINVTYV